MSLWGITMVKDEIDVLPYTLAHMVAEGVDGFVIADNMSTDGTWEWLCEHVARMPVRSLLLRDSEVAYYQSVKMTEHYRQASALGADWVIPFDADEIWHCEDLQRLADVLTEDLDGDCAEVKLFNYFPTSSDDPEEPNPFRRILHRDSTMSGLMKTAVRAGIEGLVIAQGNHEAHAERPLRTVRPGMAIGHFPWRSPEQFESKIRNGARGYDAATDTHLVPLSQGAHWRDLGRILQEGGSKALRDVYDEWYLDPAKVDLVRAPVRWMG